MSNPNTPRHAHVRRGQSGRLHRALLPAALGGVVAGSVWLAADAAAAPAAHHPGEPSAGSYQATGSSSYGGGSYGNNGWSGSYSSWRDGDGYHPYGQPHSYDGQQRQYGGWQGYPGRHDWRDHSGHGDVARPRVTVTSSAAAPHHASSTAAGGDVAAARTQAAGPPASAPKSDAAAPAPGVARLAARARATNAVRPSTPTSTATAPRVSSAARSNLASVDAPREATDYVTLYGAIGGAALAGLLGMGGVALWRRRGASGTPG
jgi:hypothetical protein